MAIKEQNQDCILFYRLGDFYEMFFDDALTASRELEITLTGKNCGMEEWAPMCGVPFHAVDSYLNKLVEKGYKVAICEQVEDPKQTKGIVKREVIRIVTPGTNISQQSLEDEKNNYLMCIFCSDDSFGLSVVDVTTGDFRTTSMDELHKVVDEIFKVRTYVRGCRASGDITGSHESAQERRCYFQDRRRRISDFYEGYPQGRYLEEQGGKDQGIFSVYVPAEHDILRVFHKHRNRLLPSGWDPF